MIIRHLLSACVLVSLAAAGPLGADDDWPEDDIAENPHQVGSGELRFFAAASDSGWLHAHNRLAISAQSLEDGWVGLAQCYANLDAVADMEVVYRYRGMRGLKVTSAQGIAAAQAGEHSVSLSDVSRGARLCVSAEVQILVADAADGYVMRNGPFHRRFLDGYFPMRVTLEIEFPDDQLTFTHAEPRAQTGFSVHRSEGRIQVDTRFSGMLNLAFYFQRRAPSGAYQ